MNRTNCKSRDKKKTVKYKKHTKRLASHAKKETFKEKQQPIRTNEWMNTKTKHEIGHENVYSHDKFMIVNENVLEPTILQFSFVHAQSVSDLQLTATVHTFFSPLLSLSLTLTHTHTRTCTTFVLMCFSSFLFHFHTCIER